MPITHHMPMRGHMTPTLLHIDSSPLYGRSVSRELTAAFVSQWEASHLGGRVVYRDLIEQRGISFTDCNGALRAVALGVCDYLTEITNCPVKGALIPLEGSIIPVIEGMFMEGVAHHAIVPGIDPALIATTAAWAVFGAARRWHQTANRIPAEEMAAQIEVMVKPVFLNSFK